MTHGDAKIKFMLGGVRVAGDRVFVDLEELQTVIRNRGFTGPYERGAAEILDGVLCDVWLRLCGVCKIMESEAGEGRVVDSRRVSEWVRMIQGIVPPSSGTLNPSPIYVIHRWVDPVRDGGPVTCKKCGCYKGGSPSRRECPVGDEEYRKALIGGVLGSVVDVLG